MVADEEVEVDGVEQNPEYKALAPPGHNKGFFGARDLFPLLILNWAMTPQTEPDWCGTWCSCDTVHGVGPEQDSRPTPGCREPAICKALALD
jgi:hypothetical protein